MVVERDAVDGRLDRRVQEFHHQHEKHRCDENRTLEPVAAEPQPRGHEKSGHDELLTERGLVAHGGGEALERIARRAEDPSQPGLALVGAFGFHAARTVAETAETIPSSCAANLHRMQDAHTSSEFDQLLGRARLLLARMGARCERQLEDAIDCLSSGSTLLIDQVMRHEIEINELERSVDELVGRIIARRKPAAGDLRLLLAIIKTTTDLERIADEAKKIALCAGRIAADRGASRPSHYEADSITRVATHP